MAALRRALTLSRLTPALLVLVLLLVHATPSICQEQGDSDADAPNNPNDTPSDNNANNANANNANDNSGDAKSGDGKDSDANSGIRKKHSSSTNYEQQAISINYEGEGLPVFGTLNGTVTELDTVPHTIALNKTEASLECSSGFMNIKLNFKQPFYGIVYADYDRNSACKIGGNGKTEETIKLPLKGCGTLQSPARVFTNNIIVRFHPGLEIDGDEVITIVCRYPPPIVPPPIIPELLQLPPAEAVRPLQPLRELEILMIICAIIFLALLLLGIGCSYYCLKKRNIKVVRRRPLSTLGSDITKISEPATMFPGLKIPRAHAVDASGSEEVTESIKTDFASDIASVVSEEEYTSAYSDKMCVLAEGAIVSKLHEPPPPNFDIKMKIKSKPALEYTPAMSVASSDSELVLNAQEQYLTTILERTETNTLETLERIRAAKAVASGPPPVHARINIKEKQQVMSDVSEIESVSEFSRDGTEQFSEQELELESRDMRGYVIDGADMKTGFDVKINHRKQSQPLQLNYVSDTETTATDYSHIDTDRREYYTEDTQHIIEGDSRHGNRTYYVNDRIDTGIPRGRNTIVTHGEVHRSGGMLPPSSTNVTYHTTQHQDHQDHTMVTTTETSRTYHQDSQDTTHQLHSSTPLASMDLIRPVIQQRGDHSTSTSHRITHGRPTTTGGDLNNFDVLIRIVSAEGNEHPYGDVDRMSCSSVFTEDERLAIKQVLLEDRSVQQELKQTFSRGDLLLLRENQFIRERVEPQKWDVLIRVLGDNYALMAPSGGDRASSITTTTTSHSAFTDGAAGRGRGLEQSFTIIDNSMSAIRDGGATTTTTTTRTGGTGAVGLLDGFRHHHMGAVSGPSEGGASTAHTSGGRSAADRSGTEIVEYHHYSASAATMSHQGGSSHGWYDNEGRTKDEDLD